MRSTIEKTRRGRVDVYGFDARALAMEVRF
jgi:hypothetical protein